MITVFNNVKVFNVINENSSGGVGKAKNLLIVGRARIGEEEF